MDKKFEQLKKDIMSDIDNKKYSDKGIEPLFFAPRPAKILIIGQAPGLKAQESKIFFNDKSGVKLREWQISTFSFSRIIKIHRNYSN